MFSSKNCLMMSATSAFCDLTIDCVKSALIVEYLSLYFLVSSSIRLCRSSMLDADAEFFASSTLANRNLAYLFFSGPISIFP